MRSRLAHVALTAVLVPLVAAPVLATGVAHADSWSRLDAAHDVVAVTDPDRVDGTTAVVPEDRRSDVRRVRVTHSARVVRVTFRVRDVTSGNQVTSVILRTPGRPGTRLVGLGSLVRINGKNHAIGEVVSSASDTKCRGTAGRIRPRRDVVTFAFPTSCLQHPAWVRVSAIYGSFDGSPRKARQFNLDNAFGTKVDGFFGRTLSPRIYVG